MLRTVVYVDALHDLRQRVGVDRLRRLTRAQCLLQRIELFHLLLQLRKLRPLFRQLLTQRRLLRLKHRRVLRIFCIADLADYFREQGLADNVANYGMGGNIDGIRLASMVLPDPGGPIMITL